MLISATTSAPLRVPPACREIGDTERRAARAHLQRRNPGPLPTSMLRSMPASRTSPAPCVIKRRVVCGRRPVRIKLTDSAAPAGKRAPTVRAPIPQSQNPSWQLSSFAPFRLRRSIGRADGLSLHLPKATNATRTGRIVNCLVGNAQTTIKTVQNRSGATRSPHGRSC